MIAGVCGYNAELEIKILHGYKCHKCALSPLISETCYTRVSNKIMNCMTPILFQWKVANVTVLMDSKKSIIRKYFKI
jgi:hypothetical protein